MPSAADALTDSLLAPPDITSDDSPDAGAAPEGVGAVPDGVSVDAVTDSEPPACVSCTKGAGIVWSLTSPPVVSGDLAGHFDVERILADDPGGAGYVMAGWRGVQRVDAAGAIVWQDSGESWPHFYDVERLDGGGVVATGSLFVEMRGSYLEQHDILVRRYAPDGALVWETSFGGDGNDEGFAVIEVAPSGFAVLGGDEDPTLDDYHAVAVARLDDHGNLLWLRRYGHEGRDDPGDLVQTSDGGFFVGAHKRRIWTSAADANTWGDAWFLKLDADGDVEWEFATGGDGWETVERVFELPGGDLFAMGRRGPTNVLLARTVLYRIAPSGSLLWEVELASGGGSDMRPLSDGGWVISGWTWPANCGRADAWLARVTATGDVVWERTLGAGVDELARAVAPVPSDADGSEGYVIAGQKGNLEWGFGLPPHQESWLFRVDEDGPLCAP